MVIKTITMFWPRIATTNQLDGIPLSQEMDWPIQSFKNKQEREKHCLILWKEYWQYRV